MGHLLLEGQTLTVYMNSPPPLHPCSSLFSLSQVASLAVSVDILVGGRAAVGAMRLAPLANATGGAVLLLEDFGEPFVSNASAAVRRSGGASGRGALLSVRASQGVACTRVIGAAEAMSLEAAAAATAPSLPVLTGDGEINLPTEDTSDVFRLKSTDPSQVRLL